MKGKIGVRILGTSPFYLNFLKGELQSLCHNYIGVHIGGIIGAITNLEMDFLYTM